MSRITLDEQASQPSVEVVRRSLTQAARFLPLQGPITVFISQNSLEAFEDLPFDVGCREASRILGCQPYLPEQQYRQFLRTGRILDVDLRVVLEDDLGNGGTSSILDLGSRLQLRLAMLHYPVRMARLEELRWFIAETDAIRRMRADVPPLVRREFIEETRQRAIPAATQLAAAADQATHAGVKNTWEHLVRELPLHQVESWTEEQWEAFSLRALWRVCRAGVHGLTRPESPPERHLRPRDQLLQSTGEDPDLLVHEVLIPFCAAYLDQGLSDWELPHRDQGFWKAFVQLHGSRRSTEAWLADLPAELNRCATAEESIVASLQSLGIAPDDQDEFLTATLLALRGWAGMLWQVENRSDNVPHPIAKDSLLEFTAVRLILDRLAARHVMREAWGSEARLADLPKLAEDALSKIVEEEQTHDVDQRGFQVFQLAQVMGWIPSTLAKLSRSQWQWLIDEIEAFPSIERRRVLHAAFERRYKVQALDAISLRAAMHPQTPPPRFQVVTCLDDREESFRRHLEEILPEVETFGVAGFFCIPMYYRGVDEAHFVPLCPIVMRPQHWLTENVILSLEDVHQRRSKFRRTYGALSHLIHRRSRGFLGGALTAGVGAITMLPLVGRVLFPRLTASIQSSAWSFLRSPAQTRMTIERVQERPSSENGGLGYNLTEMTSMGLRLLQDLGLTKNFAPLIAVLGHGAYSLNNPHNSAYHCGACGGGPGAPNARAAALILNDSRVRQELRLRGIEIPDNTFFVGGFHNTCNDSVTFRDLELIPETHRQHFRELDRALTLACERNAHERCRRFMSAPLNLSFAAARRHVEGRSEDLAQTRPEVGHSTNAICFVGRRSRTRGLFMDRRAFLTSYDPTQDDADCTILTRILLPVFPVCSGISLQYFFSHIDSVGLGCGTKLPHNVTSLLGVMDGAASDLRTGLAWQMCEIHEPLRLLFVIETTPGRMQKIIDKNAGIGRLCNNGWVQLAVLDPHSNELHCYQNGSFELYRRESDDLPSVPSSPAWYRGIREHLPFALIQPDSAQQG